ncbi:MAG: hypothetical protein KGN39_08160 [Betaproteobacteria bacterium]|nr:hypothetical protein [Betaproteobacteria bacterium]
MNGSTDLDDLTAALMPPPATAPGTTAWGDPRAMTRALGEVRSRFGDMAVISESPRSARALLAFRAGGGGSMRFMDLKYACYALVRPNAWDGRRLLDDARLLAELLRQVDGWLEQPRRFRQCYRGLLASYFACPEYLWAEPSADPGFRGWQALQQYLGRHQPAVAASTPALDWTQALGAFPAMLQARPWATLAETEATTAAARWESLCRQLNVPASWSQPMAWAGRLEILCRLDDPTFRQQAKAFQEELASAEEPPLPPAFLKHCRRRLAERARTTGLDLG